MARNITITYGTFSVGATQTNALVHLTAYPKMQLEFTHGTISVSFRLTVLATTNAALVAAEAALIAAYRDIDVAVVVKVGSSNRVNTSHAANTGFLSRASVSKPGDIVDTELSSAWDVEISVQLPEDKSGRDGRRMARISVAESPSEMRVVSFTGEFTALSANSAREQYEDAASGWIADVLTDLTGFFQQRERNFIYDDEDKVVRFSDVHEEILFPESASALNHPAIRSQQFSFSLAQYGGPRSKFYPEAVAMSAIRITYRCAVLKSETTDLTALYRTVIRPNLLRVFSPLGTVVIVNDTMIPDLTENLINASLDLLVSRGGVVEATLRTVMYGNDGIVWSPAWDGNPHAKEVDFGLADEMHDVIWHILYTGQGAPPIKGRPSFLQPPKYRLDFFTESEEPYILGRPDGTTITMTEYTLRETWRRGDPVKGRPPPADPQTGGGSRGGGGAPSGSISGAGSSAGAGLGGLIGGSLD